MNAWPQVTFISGGTEAPDETARALAAVATGEDVVCLAGYMRILSGDFVEAWRDRMLNIHPSLLPLFPGLDTHESALAHGVHELGRCAPHDRRSSPACARVFFAMPVPPGRVRATTFT